MLKRLLQWLFGRRRAPAVRDGRHDFEQLNRDAPLREDAAQAASIDRLATYLCREAILDRNQRIAGYHFMLQEGTRNRIRHGSRRIQHLYAEVLVRNLVRADIGPLLGHRLAFIDIPDSFLDHPCIADLPPGRVVLMPTPHPDPGAPDLDTLRRSVERLRASGFMFAVPDPLVLTEFVPLLPIADIVILHAPALDARRGLQLSGLIAGAAPNARLLIRDVPSLEDFRFCYKLGAGLFQGPFITSREDWTERDLGPSTAHIATLIGRLRADAETHELAALLKQDAALSLRLLRYINSSANGLPERMSSIGHALALLGHDKLYRWLLLLACSTDGSSERGSAVLETALVRARMMELLGAGRPQAEREALFLVGLLSLVDVILQVPMEKAIAPLALDPAIVAAICHGDGPWSALLKLAIACEQADGEQIRLAAEHCGVPPERASECLIEALVWALEMGEPQGNGEHGQDGHGPRQAGRQTPALAD